jgi:hypothetical protein
MLGRYLIVLIPAAICGVHAYDTSASNGPLRAFGVQQPISIPHSHACKVDLIQHSFANSYGQPAIANYAPPTECGDAGTWSSVVLNLTATSSGVSGLCNGVISPHPTSKLTTWLRTNMIALP